MALFELITAALIQDSASSILEQHFTGLKTLPY